MAYQSGYLPKPGAEELEHFEQAYTRKGFFGTFAWLYKTEDPGRVTKADDELLPKHLDLRKLEPPDLREAAGLPVRVLSSEDVALHVTRRSAAMPFCWRNADADELHFVHRGSCRFETEFGALTANAGDFVYLGRNVVYRMLPESDDLLAFILETRELLETAEAFHRARGLINAGIDARAMIAPEIGEIRGAKQSEYEVKTKVCGRIHSAYFDYDPVGVTVGWAGDPIVFKMSAWAVPVARSPFPPPSSAAFLTPEGEDCVVGVRRAAIGRVGAPGHSNDWDELWFLHSATREGVADHTGLLRWDPQGISQTGSRYTHPKDLSTPPDMQHLNINIDVKRRLVLSEAAASVLVPAVELDP